MVAARTGERPSRLLRESLRDFLVDAVALGAEPDAPSGDDDELARVLAAYAGGQVSHGVG